MCCDVSERELGPLRDIAGTDTIHCVGALAGEASVDPRFARCQVAFGNVPPPWLEQAPALRWIQLESVGFDQYRPLDWPALGQRIQVTNLPGFFTEPVAESALAGVLALYRGIDRAVRLQAERCWRGDALRQHLRTLNQAEVVLFGYGAINRRFAELLAPFGCTITHFASDWTSARLDNALRRADLVASVVPETDRTVSVFDEARLTLLKDTAVFVNFGRGSVVNEDALVRRLSTGRLAGAVIDVTRCEPLPREHPLWRCDNAIITQHSGGGTHDEMARKIDVFARNLERYRAHERLAGVVDFARGY